MIDTPFGFFFLEHSLLYYLRFSEPLAVACIWILKGWFAKKQKQSTRLVRLVGTQSLLTAAPPRTLGCTAAGAPRAARSRWRGRIVPFLVIVLLWQIKLNQKVSALQEGGGAGCSWQGPRMPSSEDAAAVSSEPEGKALAAQMKREESHGSQGPFLCEAWEVAKRYNLGPTRTREVQPLSESLRSEELPLSCPNKLYITLGAIWWYWGGGGGGSTVWEGQMVIPCHEWNKTVESRWAAQATSNGRATLYNSDTEFTDYFIEGQSWKGFKGLRKPPPSLHPTSALSLYRHTKRRLQGKSDLLKAQGHATRRWSQDQGPPTAANHLGAH